MAAYYLSINVGQPRESVAAGTSSVPAADIELRIERTANGMNQLEIVKMLKWIEDKIRTKGWPLA